MSEIEKIANFDIIKKNDEEQKVWGIFSMSTKNGETLVDSHGHFMDTNVLQKSAHDFVLFHRTAGEQHSELGVGKLIESIVLTEEIAKSMENVLKEAGVENPVIQPNAEFWFGAFHITKASTWELVKEGKFGGFSIGGVGRLTEKSTTD